MVRPLERFVNGGCLSRLDNVVSLLFPALPFLRNAPALAARMREAGDRPVHTLEAEFTVSVPAYTGANSHVLRMRDYLTTHLRQDLHCAYVHGSLGTCEEVAYSDFDALAILRTETVRDPRRLAFAARHLSRALRVMLRCDPLQHHGWFVLSEADLLLYPESYLPLDSLRFARALLPETGHVLRIRRNPRDEPAVERLTNTLSALIARMDERQPPRNLYALKGFLSQIMLLPALYVQARDGRGVFKRSSFALASSDFAPEVWHVMNEITAIRQDWNQTMSPARRVLLSIAAPGRRRIARRFAPNVPAALRARLDPGFYQRVRRLLILMADRVGAVPAAF